MTKTDLMKEYVEARAEYKRALKVQLGLEAKYLSDNGYVNEDGSVPGSIAELKNSKLQQIAFEDFWKNHQTKDTVRFKGAKNCLEYIERKLKEANETAA